jgi:hypothetical protein
MSRVTDLTGREFGRLTVIKRAGSNKDGRATWVCACKCGEISIKTGKLLLNGHCRSCGCMGYESRVNNVTSHRLSDTRLYTIWRGMKQRCYYPKHKDYHNYGGRGIIICTNWLSNFSNFYNWAISNGYRDDLTIDQINVNGNYEPKNCRWATWREQRLNQRSRK